MTQEPARIRALLKSWKPPGRNVLEEFGQLIRARVVRHEDTYEYETKMEVRDALPTPEENLRRIVAAAGSAPGCAFFPLVHSSVMTPEYWTDGDVEFSNFRYEDRALQKIKVHGVLDVGSPVRVMKSREEFAYDPVTMARNTVGLQRVGKLCKRRSKTWIHHFPSGTVHSLAVTCCTAGESRQDQAEIEYAGHVLPLGSGIAPAGEEDIVAALVAVTEEVAAANPDTLAPHTQTKLAFLRAALGSTTP